ncbi:hypothetical protein SD81_024735 [Tolypothrix campylonemoides VB511288]|nr:hypothetical protein SD81_024735 [Tolypothrix campylonemoides VB511288]
MSDSIDWQYKLSQEYWQLPCQTICLDCVFHVLVAGAIACVHPDEVEVNCSTVTFCNSFQAAQEIESPCVSFGNDDGE